MAPLSVQYSMGHCNLKCREIQGKVGDDVTHVKGEAKNNNNLPEVMATVKGKAKDKYYLP